MTKEMEAMVEAYRRGMTEARVVLAKELIAWVREEHEHHGSLDDEWQDEHSETIAEDQLDDGTPVRFAKVSGSYPGCPEGDFPYVNSLKLEHFLQDIIDAAGGTQV